MSLTDTVWLVGPNRVRRTCRQGLRILLNPAQHLVNGPLELRVPSGQQRFRVVLNDDVRVDSVALDNPRAVDRIGREFRYAHVSAIDQRTVRRDADDASP